MDNSSCSIDDTNIEKVTDTSAPLTNFTKTENVENESTNLIENTVTLTDTSDSMSKYIKTLGDRMKNYEDQTPMIIEATMPYIARLDGRAFSKFTKGFEKPFDPIFSNAMVATMNDLVEEFKPRTGYTHSDEITLIFAQALTEEEKKDGKLACHHFSGRLQKLCSTFAGYASARFNYNLNRTVADAMYEPHVSKRIREYKATFDCRIIVFPKDKPFEIVNHMIWRSIYDCERNAIQAYAQANFSEKELHKKDNRQMIEMLVSKGINWQEIPIYVKHGIYAKRETYLKEQATRHRIANRTFVIKCTEEFYKLLMAKTWTQAADAYTATPF